MRVGLAKKVVVLVRMGKGRQFGCNVVVCLVVAFVVDGVVTIGERDMVGDVVLYLSPLEAQVRVRVRVPVLVLGVPEVLALSVGMGASVSDRYRPN